MKSAQASKELTGSVPKDVPIYHLNPTKRNFHIVLTLRNVPGALAGVSSIITSSNTNILSGQISVLDGHAHWSFFAEAEKGGTNAATLRSLLVASEYTEEVAVSEDADGLLVDNVCFPLRWNQGDRAVVIRQRALAEMFTQMRKEFGSGGSVLLYNEGYNMGRGSFELVLERAGKPFIREHLRECMGILASVGWGKFSLVSYDKEGPRLVVRVEDSFECTGFDSDRPYSQFLRGHMCSVLSLLLDAKLKCEETSCVATGSKYCEFRLAP